MTDGRTDQRTTILLELLWAAKNEKNRSWVERFKEDRCQETGVKKRAMRRID